MKAFINITKTALSITLCMAVLSSCYKRQTDYDRVPHTLDPHIYKNTWEYIRDRATGTTTADQIFSQMLAGIEYAEIDSNIYKQANKTFILLHNDAILRKSGSTTQPDCFFGANRVAGNAAAAWTDYPKEFVKNYLLYLVLDGVHDHYTLPAIETVQVNTAAPAGSLDALPAGITRHGNFPFAANPASVLKIKVLNSSPSNTSDYPIVLNEVRNVRTSSLLATNGSIHVIDRFLTTTVPE